MFTVLRMELQHHVAKFLSGKQRSEFTHAKERVVDVATLLKTWRDGDLQLIVQTQAEATRVLTQWKAMYADRLLESNDNHIVLADPQQTMEVWALPADDRGSFSSTNRRLLVLLGATEEMVIAALPATASLDANSKLLVIKYPEGV